MSARKLVLATRKSALALAQARAFVAELVARHPGLEVEELHVTTTGDRVQDRALSEVGGKGVFIKEIEEALLDGRADFAVHSLKDVPAELAPELSLACVPRREDARDVLITASGRPFAELPAASRIGTSSLRRRVQLASWRKDVEILPLRGNVDTRLRRLREGVVDAIVLARAGLVRLGLAHETTELLDADRCLPAIGQGALAIETRARDASVAELLAALDDAETRTAVFAERGVMLAVEGSCQIPVAAHALRDGEELWLRAFLAEPDGSRARRDELRVKWPRDAQAAHAIGVELGSRLKTA